MILFTLTESYKCQLGIVVRERRRRVGASAANNISTEQAAWVISKRPTAVSRLLALDKKQSARPSSNSCRSTRWACRLLRTSSARWLTLLPPGYSSTSTASRRTNKPGHVETGLCSVDGTNQSHSSLNRGSSRSCRSHARDILCKPILQPSPSTAKQSNSTMHAAAKRTDGLAGPVQ